MFQRLRLHFNRFNLEYGDRTCPYDYVKVYDGGDANANLVGEFCGPTVPGDIITTQSAAFVSFSTDYSVTRSGFNIRYSRGEPYTIKLNQFHHNILLM